MTKTYWMRQCRLCKKEDGQEVSTTSWIPEKYAKVGRSIKLKNNFNLWDYGWEVSEVFTRSMSDMVDERSQDYKHQREASDI